MRNELDLIQRLSWPPQFDLISRQGLCDENGGQLQVTFAPQANQQWVVRMLHAGVAGAGVPSGELLLAWEKHPFQADGLTRVPLQYLQLDNAPTAILIGGGTTEYPTDDKSHRSSLRSLYVRFPDRLVVSFLGCAALEYTVIGEAVSAPFGVDMSPFIV